MKEIDVSKYENIFRSETREYLTQLNQYIIKLEKRPQSSELIDAIFRNYHTVKGMAGTMEYRFIERLAHSLEDLLSLVRNGSLPVNSGIIDLMLEGTDIIEAMVENPRKEDARINSLMERISEIGEGKELAVTEKTTGKIREKIICEVILDRNTALKQARASVLISNMKQMAEIIGYSPDKISIEKGNFDDRFSVFLYQSN